MKLLKQMLKFFGISGIGWILDFIIYTSLTVFLTSRVDISNMISSFIGITFVFLFSTKKVFINNSKISLKIKYLIYIIYQVVLILIVSEVMLYLKKYFFSLDIKLLLKYINIVVKVIVTPFTMLINFIVIKKLIEKI